MPPRASDESHDLELDLPPLDGGEDGDAASDDSLDLDLDAETDANALDDATAEDEPIELAVEGAEGGWLVDAEEEEDLDVGAFDLAIDESAGDDDAGDDDAALEIDASDDLSLHLEAQGIDTGEEGPLDADDDLREEDLPELDADEEGDAVVELDLDDAAFGENDELRWDDRAWEHLAAAPVGDAEAEDAEAHLLGHDPASPRDATWRGLESTGRVTASVVVPGGAVVVAMNERTGALLVRISNEGAARIIAEIEAENDHDDVHVSSLRWDASRTCVVAISSSGTHAFRPR